MESEESYFPNGVTPLNLREFELDTAFCDLSKPFKYEDEEYGVSEKYMAYKRKRIAHHLETPEDDFFLEISRRRAFDVDILEVEFDKKVSSKSGLPYVKLNVYGTDSKGRYLFLQWMKFNIDSDEDYEEVRRHKKDLSSGNKVSFNGRYYHDEDNDFETGPLIKIDGYKILGRSKKRDKVKTNGRIDLGIRTQYSFIDGLNSMDEWVEFAGTNDVPCIGVSDVNNVISFCELENQTKRWNKNNDFKVKPVYGVTLFIESFFTGSKDLFHIKVYAKNQKGIEEIYSLITYMYETQRFNPSPKINWEFISDLKKSGNTFIVMPTVRGELMSDFLYQKNSFDSKIDLDKMLDMIDFLEISPLQCFQKETLDFYDKSGGVINQKKTYKEIKSGMIALMRVFYSKKKLMIFSNIPRYIYPEEDLLRETALFERKVMSFEPEDSYFWGVDEFDKSTGFIPAPIKDDVLFNNVKWMVDQIEDVVIVSEKLSLPDIDSIPDPDLFLRNKMEEGFEKNYGKYWRNVLPKEVIDRAEYEYDKIKGKYSVVYLSSLLCIEKSQEMGFCVGSRGSVGSSLVAFLSGVSDVNPLPPHYKCESCGSFSFGDSVDSFHYANKGYKVGIDLPRIDCKCGSQMLGDGWNIEFSTFMGFKGDKVADIDLNFAGTVHNKVMNYICEELFPGRAFRAGTITTLSVDGLKNIMTRLFGCNLAKNYIFSKKIDGMTYAYGKHPGGVMVFPQGKKIEEFTPLSKGSSKKSSSKDVLSAHFPYVYLHDAILKMDVLASDSIVFLEMLSRNTGIKHEIVDVFSDPVLDLFYAGDTVGINEFTTETAIAMLNDIIPKDRKDMKWSHLVSMSGLHHGTGVWKGNAQDLLNKNITTMDLIDGCRDDIVQTLGKSIGDISAAYDIVEKVRKGLGIPDDKVDLVRNCSLPDWYFGFLNKIEYMFPKAHAAAYLIISAKQAWYKVNKPEHFYSTYLTIKSSLCETRWCFLEVEQLEYIIEGMKKELRGTTINRSVKDKKINVLRLIIEAKKRKISLVPPDINNSLATEWCVCGGKLIAPFNSVSGVGEKAAESYVVEREENGLFKNLYDFYVRCSISSDGMLDLKNYNDFEWGPRIKEQGDIERKRRRKELGIKKKEEASTLKGQRTLLSFFES